MNKPISLIAAMMLATTAQLWAPQATAGQTASDLDDIKKETQELIQAIQSYSIEQKDQALAKAADALERLDERIDVLEKQLAEQWQSMDAATQQERQALLNSLKTQRAEVADWLAKMQDGSSGAWGQLKQGVADAYHGLAQAWEKAKQLF